MWLPPLKDGGNVFICICLSFSVRKIALKVMNGFCWNFAQSFGTRDIGTSSVGGSESYVIFLYFAPFCPRNAFWWGSNILLLFAGWQHNFRDSQFCCSVTPQIYIYVTLWNKTDILVQVCALQVPLVVYTLFALVICQFVWNSLLFDHSYGQTTWFTHALLMRLPSTCTGDMWKLKPRRWRNSTSRTSSEKTPATTRVLL